MRFGENHNEVLDESQQIYRQTGGVFKIPSITPHNGNCTGGALYQAITNIHWALLGLMLLLQQCR